jgi:hypothetical protein
MTPTLSEILACAGWRWKTALALLIASPACWLLPSFFMPWAGLALLAMAVLLALTSTIAVLRQVLQSPETEATVVEAVDPLMTLNALLEGQRGQMHEAAAAVSRAVTAGAQLASLTRGAEQQWRQLLEQGTATRAAAAPTSMLEELRASMALAQETAAVEREAMAKVLQQRLDQVEDRLASMLLALQTKPPSPAAMEVPPALLSSLIRLDEVSRQLALQTEGHAHHEASLGDAARYLTETADRLRDGTQSIETQALRLQAMLMVQRHQEAAQTETVRQENTSPIAEAPKIVSPLLKGLVQHLRSPYSPPS